MGRKTIFNDIQMYFVSKPNYWRAHPGASFDGELGLCYYLDLRPRMIEGHFDMFDENGVPIRNYGGRIGVQYSPVNVCAYALACLQMDMESSDSVYEDRFLIMANWLVDNQKIRGDIGYWVYDFNWRGLRKPWYSGMAQGEALSVLARAYQITGERRYLDCATKAIQSFAHTIGDGGVVSRTPNGYICFEEYAVEPATHVLNGFIYAILGIFDYSRLTNSSFGGALLGKAQQSIENILPLYDTGFWSKYDLNTRKVNLASAMYHELHVTQLRILGRVFSSSIIEAYADKWEHYATNVCNRSRALVSKLGDRALEFVWHK